MGFARAYCVPAEPFSLWEKEALSAPDPRWANLQADPRVIMPGARGIIVLIWAYSPYSAFPEGEPSVDAYYPASQSAHMAAKNLAQILQEQGYQADPSAPLPAKRALLRTGDARYGRCGLLALDRPGTRICIQTILTDAPFPAVDHRPENEIDPRCEGCGRCIMACPAGAILPNARVDTQKCLRAQSYTDPVPEKYRPLIGRSLLGCDICQRACARNAAVQETMPPPELIDALRLERLLRGDVKPLAAIIGSNYARPVRMQARAALIAANLGRNDLLPLLEELCSHSFENVREHALWAVKKLK